jgi:hypothetical protein
VGLRWMGGKGDGLSDDRIIIGFGGGLGTQLQVEVEVDRQQVEGRGSRPGKVEVEDIDDKSTNKRSKCGHEMTD